MQRLLTAVATAALVGCQPPGPPGDPAGVYAVSGALEENTCGRAGLPAEETLSFSVELRDDGLQGHWLVGGEVPGVAGTLDAEGRFLFGQEQLSPVGEQPAAMMVEQPEDYFGLPEEAPPASPQMGSCTLSIIERIEGAVTRRLGPDGAVMVVDDDPMLDDLAADNRIEITPLPGSDCRAALAVEGGPFLALPCYAQYTLTGTLED